MNPSEHELESKLACRLLSYALPILGQPIPEWVLEAAAQYYGAPQRLEESTVMLCSLCRSMDDAQKAHVIYDGRNAESRRLADWWDKHQEADAVRERRESYAASLGAAKATALAKLSEEEKSALGLA